MQSLRKCNCFAIGFFSVENDCFEIAFLAIKYFSFLIDQVIKGSLRYVFIGIFCREMSEYSSDDKISEV